MNQESFEQVQASVAAFLRTKVMPRETEIDDSDSIPDDLRRAAAEMGLFGYALPERYGGLAVTMAQDVELALEFGYVSAAFRSLFGTNNGIAGQMLAHFASPVLQERYLPDMCSGRLIASFALTESEAGSDPGALRATAKRTAGGWLISGTKRFITNAPLAGLFVVFARAAEDAGDGMLSAFVVRGESPGLTVGPHDAKLGQRGAWTAEVRLEDVFVPGDHLIGDLGTGYRSALTVLSRGRLHIAALCVGAAQRVLDEVAAHVTRSKSGRRALASFQLVQAMVAESYAEMVAGRALVRDVARAYDAGTDRVLGPSAAKLFCSEMVSRVADRGVQAHGGMGYMRSTAVERIYRDSRLYRIYEGTSEIQKLVIARNLLRLDGSVR